MEKPVTNHVPANSQISEREIIAAAKSRLVASGAWKIEEEAYREVRRRVRDESRIAA